MPPSRLTTGFFWISLGASLLAGLAGQLLMAWRPEAFAGVWFREPTVLVAVHLTTLGFLALLILGVLTQFVPMLLGKPARSLKWAGISMAVFFFASILLWSVMGFWRQRAAAMAAGLGILMSLGLYVWQLLKPLLNAKDHRLARASMASSFFYLLMTAALGALMALGLVQAPLLPQDPLRLLRLHLHLGLFGFGGLMVYAVSYELLPMFNLSRGYKTWPGWLALVLAHAGILLLAFGTFFPSAPGPEAWAWLLAFSCLAFTLQLVYLWRKAPRKQGGANFWLFRQGIAFLLLSAAWGLCLIQRAGNVDGAKAAYVFLGLFGFLGGVIFSQLQKIVPLLSWYDRFSMFSGTAKIPQAHELQAPALAWSVAAFHALAVISGSLGLVRSSVPLLGLSGILGALCFAANFGLLLHGRLKGTVIPFAEGSRS